MIYAFVLGVSAGFFPNVTWGEALGIVLVFTTAKAVYGMVTGKEYVSETESHYSLYVRNIDTSKEAGLVVRLTYLVQVLVFGGLIGMAGFGLVRLFT